MNMRSAVWALLMVVAMAAKAGTPIDEVRPGQPGMLVKVQSVAGSVRVLPGADDQVQVRGTLGSGSKPLRVEGDSRRLEIVVEAEGSGWGGTRVGPTTLEVTVPASARLDVATVSADVEVAGVSGEEVRLETVSGRIDYRGGGGRVRLKSVSGGITGTGSGRQWIVGTVSGRIRLPEAAGELDLETVSGAIEVTFGQAGSLKAETVSGAITAEGALLPEAEVDLQSVSGGITLRLRDGVDARIRAKTFSGRIESDFGTPERSGMAGGQTLDTIQGEGRGDVRLESFSGRVSIRRGG